MDRRPAQQTVVTAQQVLEALAQAYADFFHAPVDKTALMILLAQSAFETGWWKFMWNNNLGNYKAVSNGTYDWTYFTCYEYLTESQIPPAWHGDSRIVIEERPGQLTFKVTIHPDHPACCFASFQTLSDGAFVYLSKLVRQYSDPNDQGPKDAWHWAVVGDVPRFASALRSHGYFTDDLGHYAGLVESCKKRLEGMGLNWDALPSWPAQEAEEQPIVHPSIFNEPDET
jgi:hypothetical protein